MSINNESSDGMNEPRTAERDLPVMVGGVEHGSGAPPADNVNPGSYCRHHLVVDWLVGCSNPHIQLLYLPPKLNERSFSMSFSS